MEPRLTVIGLNIIAVSIILGLIGWGVGEYSLIGVAFSILLFGITSLVLGLGYREPSIEFLKHSYEVMRSAIMKLAEDLHLVNHRVYIVPGEDGSYIVLTSNDRLPNNIVPVMGLSDGEPYIAVKAPRIVLEGVDTQTALSELVVDRYMIASMIRVIGEGENYRIIVSGVNPSLKDLLAKPLSPITMMVLTAFSQSIGKPVMLVEDRVVDNNLELSVRVIQ